MWYTYIKMTKNNKKPKREHFFIRVLNKLLKLDYLKILELSIGFVRGFHVKVEFFDKKAQKK